LGGFFFFAQRAKGQYNLAVPFGKRLLEVADKALQRKGFECYLADYDCSMLVAFDI
jgi:hypothetical protein